MTQASNTPAAKPAANFSRAVLVLADGTVFEGHGFGATTEAVGEVCFNTAMTGYQEILTDPSYAGQIVAFTFPHIGIVGTNGEDLEEPGKLIKALQLVGSSNAEPLARQTLSEIITGRLQQLIGHPQGFLQALCDIAGDAERTVYEREASCELIAGELMAKFAD